MMSWYGRTILQTFLGGRITAPLPGRFGVEVEIEGRGLPNDGVAGWRVENDSSLRGESHEYVFQRPEDLTQAQERILGLYDAIRRNGGRVNDSMRAGVHVHVNMTDRTIQQVATFMTLYWIVESVVIRNFAGEDRDGNAFCMKLSEADYPLDIFTSAMVNQRITGDDFSSETLDLLKYSSMNWAPLYRYGSLEFRSLRTPTEPGPLINWVLLLNELFTASAEFTSPLALLQEFSRDASGTLVQRLFGEFYPQVRGRYTDEELRRNVRRIQPLAFEPNWR